MDKTQVERTRRYREKQRERGTVSVTVQCPAGRVDELKALVKGWRKQNREERTRREVANWLAQTKEDE